MIRQFSRTTALPILDENHKRALTNHSASINRLAEDVAEIVSQQRPAASAIPKPFSTSTLMFDGKIDQFEQFEDLFHTMLNMQPEMR